MLRREDDLSIPVVSFRAIDTLGDDPNGVDRDRFSVGYDVAETVRSREACRMLPVV